MGRELLTVNEPVLMTVKAPQRESGQVAPGPICGAALPATNRLEPFSRPTVAPPGTETGVLTGHSDVRNDVALGTGIMDWPAIFKAARKAGVKWYFIEDESPTVVDQIPVSLRYLERVKF